MAADFVMDDAPQACLDALASAGYVLLERRGTEAADGFIDPSGFPMLIFCPPVCHRFAKRGRSARRTVERWIESLLTACITFVVFDVWRRRGCKAHTAAL